MSPWLSSRRCQPSNSSVCPVPSPVTHRDSSRNGWEGWEPGNSGIPAVELVGSQILGPLQQELTLMAMTNLTWGATTPWGPAQPSPVWPWGTLMGHFWPPTPMGSAQPWGTPVGHFWPSTPKGPAQLSPVWPWGTLLGHFWPPIQGSSPAQPSPR